jgi:hypothetical protein
VATVDEIHQERVRLHGIIQDRAARRAMFGPEDKYGQELEAFQQDLLKFHDTCEHANKDGFFCNDCGKIFEGATELEMIKHLQLRFADWGVWLLDPDLMKQSYSH